MLQSPMYSKQLFFPENRYRQKGGLKFLPSYKIQHNKYREIMKFGRAASREIPGPAQISQPACTEPSRSGLLCLPCSHRSDS